MVFEKIVGQVLARSLGDYLEGLDKNISLGLWQGELSLQNVRIKKDVLRNLGLPIEISFGLVEQLKLKIPWKSIQSSKTEVTLNGLYLIADILPQDKWIIPSMLNNLQKRKADIQKYTQELIASLLKKKPSKGDSGQEVGFTQKLILRVIDNLQINISGIHVRLQSQDGYAMGVTLESIKLSTVNKQGKDEYIDRTKEEHRNDPLRKKLYLRNLGVYWDTNAKNLKDATSLDKGVIASMNYMIHKGEEKPQDKKYILFISSEVNLLQREKGQQFQEPQLHFQISVKHFNIQLQNKQLQQIVDLSEKARLYTQKRTPKRSINLSGSGKTQIKNQERFRQIFLNYYNTSHMSQEETADYQRILAKVEAQDLFPIIKEVVKESERKKMLEDKSVKKTGWFTWSKQQLTPEEIQEVEEYLGDNLLTSAEEIKVSRLKGYSFLRVDLYALQSEISVGKSDNSVKRGVSVVSVDLRTTLMLREQGFKVQFEMSDLIVNLFTQKGMNIVSSPFYRKSQHFREHNYIQAVFDSKPVQRPYIDAQITIRVRPGVLTFSPLILSRLKQFAKVKLSESSGEIAIETYSSVKNKAAKSLEQSIEDKKLKVINVDIQVLAPLIIIPFQVNNDKDCWAISMKDLRILTDPKMLNPGISKTSQIYQLRLTNVWMSSYKYKGQIMALALGDARPQGVQQVVNNFNIEVSIQLERKKEDITKADLTVSVQIPKLNLCLGSSSYANLRNMGRCFVQPTEVYLAQEDPIQMIKSEKEQILANSEKVGIVYKKNIHSMFWNKYIGVLSGNYLYLYSNRKDISYDSFVYIKNARVTEESKQLSGRDNTVRVQNNVSSQFLSFQSSRSLEEWKELIQSTKHQFLEPLDDSSVDVDSNSVKKSEVESNKSILYMKTNTQIKVIISAIDLVLFDFTPESPWLRSSVQELNLAMKKYPCYTYINVTLGSLELVDHLHDYRNPELAFLLRPDNNRMISNLLSINVIQAQAGDPRYRNIDNQVSVVFGRVIFNWKPNSVNKLLRFFSSNSPPPLRKVRSMDMSETQIQSVNGSVRDLNDSVLGQRLSLKVEVRVQNVLVNLVNKYNRVKQGSINFEELTFNYEMHMASTVIRVNAQDLVVNDCENYPNTIVAEIEYTPNSFVVLKARNQQKKGIVQIEVISMQKPNSDGIDLVIHVTFHQIVIDLILDPFLRTVWFVTDQVIPSLSTSNPSSKPPAPLKPQAPIATKLQLIIKALDSSILLKPTRDSKQRLELKVADLTVFNKSILRQYTTCKEKVLVSLYSIQVSNLQIFRDRQQLTNHFEISVNLEFMNNTEFYKGVYGDSLLPGTRIFLLLSPIVIRLSNEDFRFIMKCVNWNLTYSDNCQDVLYPPEKKPEPVPVASLDVEEKKPGDPLYLSISVKMLTAAVVDLMVPISNIALNLIQVNLEIPDEGVKMKLTVNSIIGSYFVYTENHYVQKGMIGKLATYGEHTYQQLTDLQQLVRLFNKQDQYLSQKDDLTVVLSNTPLHKQTQVTLEKGTLNLQLKHLLKISKLFSLEGLQNPPQPRFKYLVPRNDKPKDTTKASSRLEIRANSLIVSTGDQEHQEIKILGQLHVTLANREEKTLEQSLAILEKDYDAEITFGDLNIQITNLQLYLTYRPKDGRPRKRTLLNPVSITVEGSNSYTITSSRELCVSNKYGVRINSLMIEATISDSIRFQNIVNQNKKIIDEFNQTNQIKKPAQKLEVQVIQAILMPKQKKPLDKTLITRIDFGDTEILLVNDANNMFVPIIKFTVHSIKPSSYIMPSKSELSLTSVLEASFFNPRSARWEPVLEKTTLNLKTSSSKINQDDTESNFEILVEEGINVNLSSQLLISLLVSIEFAKEVRKMLQDRHQYKQSLLIEENGLQLASPYTVQNITRTQFKIILTDASLKKLQFDNRPQAREYIQKHRETLVPPKFKGYIFIPSEADQIDIQIGEERYTTRLNRQFKHRIGKSRLLFSCHVDGLTRVIKISEETTLTNMLDVPLYVQYGQSNLKIEPNDRIPLAGVQEFRISRINRFLSGKITVDDLGRQNTISCTDTHQYYNIAIKSYDVNGLKYTPLFVLAPLKIVNYLPKPLIFQLHQVDQESPSKLIPSQEQCQIHTFPHPQNVQLKIYIPGFHWSKSILLSKFINKEFDVVLRDIDLHFCVVKLLIQRKQDYPVIEINIYTPGYIINDTPFDLCFYVSPSSDNKEKNKSRFFKTLAGQKKIHLRERLDNTIILLGADAGNELKISDKKEDGDWMSEPVGIMGMNEAKVQVVRKHNSEEEVFFVTLAIEVDLKQMSRNSNVLSKEVRFKIKHIIHNTARRIHWKQVETKEWFTLNSGQKEILYLLNNDKDVRFVVKTDTSSESAFLQVSGLGEIYFGLEEKGKPVYMKIDNKAADGYVVMVISQVHQRDLPYQFHNNLNDQVVVRMIGFDRDVHPSEKVNFVWSDPNDEKVLKLTLISEDQPEYSLKIKPDQVNEGKEAEIMRNGVVVKLKIYVRVDKDKRIVTIDQEEDIEEKETKLSTTKILLKEVGISIVMNHQGLPKAYEAFFISMKHLELFYQQTSRFQIMQFRMRFLQIDQNSPEFIKNPVMLTPQRFDYFSKNGQDQLINVLVKRDVRSRKETIIKQVLVEVKDLSVRVSQDSIQMILALRAEMVNLTDPKNESFKIERKVDGWREQLALEQNHKVYIQHIAISQLIIKLTASTNFGTGKEKSINKQQELMGRFFTAFGVAFANIEDSLLVFNGIDLDHIFDSPSGIQQKLFMHYKATALKEIYKVFVSLTVLGDPRGLFLNITTGLTDLVSRPAQGLVKGPLQLGKGLASGAQSLYSHVTGGVLGSVTKMIRSLSTGINILTFDQKYIHQNLMLQSRKVKGLVPGLQKGTRILIYALKDTILGIIVKPLRGAQRQGVLGFVIGSMTALAGIVIKPIGGVLDFLWIVLDSIKNTITFQEDSANEFRIRQPRVFYGPNSTLRQYSEMDSNSMLLLKQKNLLGEQTIIMQTFQLSNSQVLVLMNNKILLVKPESREVVWSIDLKNISNAVKTHRGIQIKSKVVGNQKQLNLMVDTSNVTRQTKEQIREVIEAALHDLKDE